MGSAVLVFEEYYNTDGYFTICSKILSSAKRMFIDTIIPLIAGCIVLGILIGQKVVSSNADALQLAAVIVTNTIYEAGLMFLLGYGIVEFPRTLWTFGNLEGYLLKSQQKAAADFKAIADAQLDISLLVANVLKTKEAISAYGDQKLQAAMSVLQADCPPEFKASRIGEVAKNKSGQITMDSLASLRTKLNQIKDRYKMAEAKAERTALLAYTLEDLVTAKKKGRGPIYWSLLSKDSTMQEYKWYCIYRPVLYRVAAVAAFCLSVLSFIGVVSSMHNIPPDGSPYFTMVHSAATPGGIVIFILVTLGYSVFVTLWSLFQMKLGGMMEMVQGRTTPESLSFNVRMIVRLAAPLAFFYLGWISENGLTTGWWTENANGTSAMLSAFSNFYQLQQVAVIRNTFGTIFPVLLFCVVGLIIPNLLNRILVMIKMENYQFGAEIVTEEQLREGKRQLERKKKIFGRKFEKRDFKNRIMSLTKAPTASGFMAIFTGKKNTTKGSGGKSMDAKELIEVQELKEPDALSGILEKKASRSMGLGSSWGELRAVVKAPGELQYFKDAKDKTKISAATLENSRDLRLVLNFKANPSAYELELEFADSSDRLRFRSASEMERWKAQLQEWKDYAIDFEKEKPVSADIETGTRGSSSLSSSMSSAYGNRSSAAESLDSIDISVEPEPKEEAKKKAFGGFGSAFSGSKERKNEADKGKSASSFADSKPAALEGWLEKKGGAKVVGSDWQRRYVRVEQSSGSLQWFKSSSSLEKPNGSLDMLLIADVTPYATKGGKADSSRFNVDMGDGNKMYKFKASSDAEGDKWIKGLNDWKDYLLLNMRK